MATLDRDAAPQPTLLRWLVLVLAIAGANYVSGRLGLLLALPPGFATAVWPPSGVALGAVLVFGYRVWPGVWLGSFAMNIFIAEQTGPITHWLDAAAVATAIASGSTLQALVGTGLIRRYVRWPSALLFEREIILLLLLGGPLSCVIAASFGIGTLLLTGVIPPSAAPFQWWTWWVGDTIGVLVLMPLMLIALAQPRPIWRGRWLPVGLPLIFSFAVSVVFFVYSSRAEQSQFDQAVERQQSTLRTMLTNALDRKLDILTAISGLFDVSEDVNRHEFHRLSSLLLPQLSGVQAIEWAPRVAADQREDYERAARADGLDGFRFNELINGTVQAAAMRQEYFPVYFIEPMAGNRAALGLDLQSNQSRRLMLQRASDDGLPIASEPISLVQDPTKQHGVMIAMPVYRKGRQHLDPAQRRRNLIGYVLMALRMSDMVTNALRSSSNGDILIAIDDQTAGAGSEPVLPVQIAGRPLTATDQLRPGQPWRSTSIAFAGRQWQLRLAPTVEAVGRQRSLVAWAVLIGGMLFTSLLGAFLLAVNGRAIQVRQLMDQRLRADERFRLTVEAAPNAMVITDHHGRITLVNAEFERLFGYRRDELLGQCIDLLLPEAKRASHRHDREGFLKQPSARAMGQQRELYGQTKSGARVPVEIGLSPLKTDEGTFVLASIIDTTERQRAERALRDLNRDLEHQVGETRSAMARLQETQEQLVLSEKLAALGDLVAGVSHEINTPVGIGITAASHLEHEVKLVAAAVDSDALKKSQFKRFLENSQKSTQIILANLQRAAELVQSFKRLSVDQSTYERRRIDLRDYMEQILVSLRPKFKHTPHRVVIDCPPDLQLDTVPGALAQIQTNLVVNALVHAFAADRPGTMTITARREADQVRLTFADDGVGIAPEHLKKVFVPFFTTRRGQGGTGLGLNIVFNLVHETLGGQISVDSTPGRGTTFTVLLPTTMAARPSR